MAVPVAVVRTVRGAHEDDAFRPGDAVRVEPEHPYCPVTQSLGHAVVVPVLPEAVVPPCGGDL